MPETAGTKVIVNESSLQNIADAIRILTKSTTKYKPSEMGDAIKTIQNKVRIWISNKGKDPHFFWYYDIEQKMILEQSITPNESFTVDTIPGILPIRLTGSIILNATGNDDGSIPSIDQEISVSTGEMIFIDATFDRTITIKDSSGYWG